VYNMRAYLATCIIGSFAFDEKGNLLEYKLFPKDPKKVAEKLRKTRSGQMIPEEKEIIDALKVRGCKEIIWDKNIQVSGISCLCERDNLAVQKLNSEFRRLALDLKWSNSQADINNFLTKVNIELTKSELKKEKPDMLIMRVISVIDELDKEINVFSEMLREWYGLHFPESCKVVSSNQRLAEIVAKYGRRENIEDKDLSSLARDSSGMDLSDTDIHRMQDFSREILHLYELRKKLTNYLEEITRTTIPNLSAIAGPLLAARLLSLAGGLSKISKLPSSTIQLLGAEKALFRHLRGEGKAPKYGVLFGHPYIQQAPKELKGKIARLIASKLSLASRMDMFSGRDEGERLKKELEEQVRKVMGK
ncbi:MAG TPA: C/D box methylation guide ribonucleoprotein complex aNOP56 subunit, partial [Candidatus Aenigmarchaeota archaeon]|nr:C/D box methylation guide ribonucleoprotein complex aNOP56 subunit [Candidatus Aenigmarchaeota archaeon]